MKQSVWTVPNALSILRLLGIPLYLSLVASGEYGWAVLTLMFAGATDYFDGKIARRFNQTSRFGELLDPAADRLYILVILFSLWDLELMPAIVPVLIIGRDALLAILLMVMRRRGFQPFTVTYLGKAATFNLLYAFPLLLLTLIEVSWLSTIAFIAGWAFSLWGIFLYLYTGMVYFVTGWRLISGVGSRPNRLVD